MIGKINYFIWLSVCYVIYLLISNVNLTYIDHNWLKLVALFSIIVLGCFLGFVSWMDRSLCTKVEDRRKAGMLLSFSMKAMAFGIAIALAL